MNCKSIIVQSITYVKISIESNRNNTENDIKGIDNMYCKEYNTYCK